MFILVTIALIPILTLFFVSMSFTVLVNALSIILIVILIGLEHTRLGGQQLAPCGLTPWNWALIGPAGMARPGWPRYAIPGPHRP